MIDLFALFACCSPLLERKAVLLLHLTYHLPSICRFAVSDCPVRYWPEVMREVNAKVEISDGFCIMLPLYTARIVAIVFVTVPVDRTRTVFGMRAFDVQSKSGRVGGLRE